jgi:hypothetical protein
LSDPVYQEDWYISCSLEDYNEDIPQWVLKVAFQPTARGGPFHFCTGNIRLVHTARGLLAAETREAIACSPWMAAHMAEAGRDFVIDEDWKAWLIFEHGMEDTKDSALSREEELVVKGQFLYPCPSCNVKYLI